MKTRVLLLSILCAGATSASATLLTFDITNLGDGGTMPQTYGDRVTSLTNGSFSYGAGGGFTPGVLVDYFSPDAPIDLNLWTTGYNDLTNVLENEPDGEASFTLRLTADPGSLVRLDGFDVGNYGGTITVPGIIITDGLGNTLFSRLNFVLPDSSQPFHQDYDFAGGLTAQQINIFVDTTGLGGNSDNVGLDNVQFAQVVPEPSTWAALAAGGLLALGSLFHRRQSRTG